MNLTFFIQLNATKEWLSLSIAQREQFVAQEIGPLLQQAPSLKVQFYDAEFFGAVCSDVLQIDTNNLAEYTQFWDRVRSSKVFTAPYFEVRNIIPAKRTHVLG